MTINVLTNLREHIIIHILIVAPPMNEARDIFVIRHNAKRRCLRMKTNRPEHFLLRSML